MGYQNTAIKGVSWTALLRGMLRGSALIKTAILARFLTPEQFGLFGIAAIVLGFLEMFTETGINVVLIQEESDSIDHFVDTAYVISIIRGFIIGLLILLTTPLVIKFFDQPQAAPLLITASLVPMIKGWINPSIIMFQKQLAFQKEFWFRNAITIAEAGTAILIALLYATPMALVISLIVSAILEVIISHLAVNPKPKLKYDKAAFHYIVSKGKWITGAGIASYFFIKLPEIVIGRLLGIEPLGYYQMAYRFTGMPVDELTDTLNRVAFPIYVKFSNDTKRIIRAVKKNYYVLAVIIAPLCVGILYAATPFTRFALGPNWLPASSIMAAFIPLLLLKGLNAPLNPLILARGAQRYLSLTSLAQLIFGLVLIIPATDQFGMYGVIASITLAFLLSTPIRIFMSVRSIR